MVIVKTGVGVVGEGGVRITDDLKIERDIVNETGNRANEVKG